MRILFVATAFAALVFMPKSGMAQDYPWCAIQYDGDGGEISSCGYVSRQQCMDTVSGGVGGYCRQNPYLMASPSSQPAPSGLKKKHH